MSLLDIDSNIDNQECIIRSWLDKNTTIIKKWDFKDHSDPKIEIKNNIVNIRSTAESGEEWTIYIHPSIKKLPTELFRFDEVEGNIQIGQPYSYEDHDYINMIESLEGLPTACTGNLCIQESKSLKSFKGLPNFIGGNLHLEETPIQLPEDAQYFPENVMGNIYVELDESKSLQATYLYEKVKFLSGHIKGYYKEVYAYGEIKKVYNNVFDNPREYCNKLNWDLFK